MDSKSETHQKIMSFLDEYFKNTPKHIISSDISSISKLPFAGVSALNYFQNFDTYYNSSNTIFYNDFVKRVYPINTLNSKYEASFDNIVNFGIERKELAKYRKKLRFKVSQINVPVTKFSSHFSNKLEKKYEYEYI